MEISEEKKRKRSDLIAVNNSSAAAVRKFESTYITKRDKTSPSSKPPPPSEEEVEEFFSIIRRLRAAHHDLQGSVCGRISVDDHVVKNWTTVVSETDLRRQINCDANRSGDMTRREEDKEVINDLYHETTVVGRSTKVIVMNGVRKLDLNAVPIEAETNI